MIILLVGGSKSGKSMAGQRYSKKLCNNGNLYYIATMKPYDNEDLKRIENHIEDRRGWGFKTIEKAVNISELENNISENDTILIDSITSLITNEMFKDNSFIPSVSDKIYSEIEVLTRKINNVVIVTDYLFSDGIIYDDYTETFRREIGKLNIALAKIADVVIEYSFNNEIIHKGENYVRDLNEKFI